LVTNSSWQSRNEDQKSYKQCTIQYIGIRLQPHIWVLLTLIKIIFLLKSVNRNNTILQTIVQVPFLILRLAGRVHISYDPCQNLYALVWHGSNKNSLCYYLVWHDSNNRSQLGMCIMEHLEVPDYSGTFILNPEYWILFWKNCGLVKRYALGYTFWHTPDRCSWQ